MDDDDEFGDLYNDVVRPISAPIQPQFNPQPLTTAVPFKGKEIPKSATTLVDLNLSSDDDDENEVLLGAPNSNSTAHLNSRPGTVFGSGPRGFDLNQAARQDVGTSDGLSSVKFDLKDRFLENNSAAVRLEEKAFCNSSLMDDADIDVVVEERDDKDDDFVLKDFNSEGEDEKIKIKISGNGSATNVGLGQGESRNGDFMSDQIIPGISAGGVHGGAESHGNASFENDFDSDSEDDLQIVLNDTYHGPMGMENVGGGGLMGAEEEDDEDEDGDPLVIVADNDDPNRLMMTDDQEWGGEEVAVGGDGEKKDPGDVSKVIGVGGSSMAPKTGYSNHVYHHPFPSQFKYVRPGAAPMTGAASLGGATPGQVRPPGGMMSVAGRGRGDWRPAGYGAQVWGSGGAGRGYGIGLEFTLPSHKTIFEVDIDNFEEKPWRLPGIDVSDFFNFSLNEESWKDYCKQLEQFRLEKTMQSKIRVYESGRTEQDYDPDLPPELAAATGIQDIPLESAKQGMADDGQSDVVKGPAARLRHPLPTGRAIPVGTGSGDRLPSIDQRKPRISDLDVIIEIICHDSGDDDSSHGNDLADHPDNDRPIQDLTDCNEFEVIRHDDTDYIDPVRRSPSHEPVDSRERSPNFSSARDERRETEECLESGDANRSGASLSPRGDIADVDIEHKDRISNDEIVEVAVKESETYEKEESLTDTHEDASKTLKLSSHVEEEEDLKTRRSSERNSPERSGSSKENNWKRQNVGVEHSTRVSYNKKFDSREKQDIDRHRNSAIRGREEVYPPPHKGWGDPYSYVKHERDRRKEEEVEEEEIHGRRPRAATEDIRKREHHHHRSKIQEIESEKDERYIRKQTENNGGWRSSTYERDNIASKHRDKEDYLKIRNNNDNIDNKRRKEETKTYLSNRRKRERDDVFDSRRRDDIPRLRNNEDQHNNIRVKDDVLFQRQREREEWHRVKKPNEEMRSRVSEENAWTSQSTRGKDDYNKHIEKDYYSPGRQKELLKRRDQIENGLPQNTAREDLHTRGGQLSNNSVGERRGRHESRASTRDDHASNISSDSRIHEKKHKQNPRKSKEYEVFDRNSSSLSKKNHLDKNSGQTTDTVRLKNRGAMGSDENKHLVSKKSRDDVSSGDEQVEAKRGRSKLERWTSNKERDFSVVVKPTISSIKSNKQFDAPQEEVHHPTGNEKDAGGGGDIKPVQDNVHLDTVEKLKKRSERFKLPMPVERETTTATKKMETEEIIQIQIPASSSTCVQVQPENHGDSEVKNERPTRKRRWTSS